MLSAYGVRKNGVVQGEDENEKKDNKQRIASAGMKFLKILEKLGDLENE